MEKIRAGIVGSGLIASKKHVPAFRKLSSKVELAGICDVNIELAKKLAATVPGTKPRVYTDMNEMIKKENLQLIDICTPPKSHVGIALSAIEQKCHVLVEKPMAMTTEECKKIVDSASKAGVQVCVAHSSLFYEPIMEARKLIAQGKIGKVRGLRIFISTPKEYMNAKPDHWAHKLPGGVIGETGPHLAYLALAFINPIVNVSVDAAKLLDYPWSRFEDYRINFEGKDATGTMYLTYGTDQWAAEVDIIGEKGFLRADLEAMTLVNYHRPKLSARGVGSSVVIQSAAVLKRLTSNVIRFSLGQMTSTHERILGEFVDAIREHRRSPVPGEEGLDAVRFLNRIVEEIDKKESSNRKVKSVA